MGKVFPFPNPTSKKIDRDTELRGKFVEAGWFFNESEVPAELIQFVTASFQECYEAGRKYKEAEMDQLAEEGLVRGYDEGYTKAMSDMAEGIPQPSLTDFLKLVKVRLQEEVINFAQDLGIKPRDSFARWVVFYTEDGWKLHLEVGEDEDYLRVEY